MQHMALYCADCERTVLEAESVGRWRGEYDDGQEQMT
jgi:hypothetical protein